MKRGPITFPPDIRLPEAFIGTGDPLGSNPFSPGDPRHDEWNELTRDAVEEVCQIGAQVLQRPKSFDELLDLVHPHDWLLNRRVAQFDVWAKRTVMVALTDDLVTAYDRWLLDYANAWLKEVARFLDNSPPPFLSGSCTLRGSNQVRRQGSVLARSGTPVPTGTGRGDEVARLVRFLQRTEVGGTRH